MSREHNAEHNGNGNVGRVLLTPGMARHSYSHTCAHTSTHECGASCILCSNAPRFSFMHVAATSTSAAALKLKNLTTISLKVKAKL